MSESVGPGAESSDLSALIIIDMVNLFDFPGGEALSKAALRIAPQIARLRQRFHAARMPVIYVNDNFLDWNRSFDELLAVCSQPNSLGAAVVNQLAPASGDYYILKPKHSAFLCSAFPVLLHTLGPKRLVLTGIAADSCVLATALDAHMRSYAISVPSNCVASLSSTRTKQTLDILAEVTQADTQPI